MHFWNGAAHNEKHGRDKWKQNGGFSFGYRDKQKHSPHLSNTPLYLQKHPAGL